MPGEGHALFDASALPSVDSIPDVSIVVIVFNDAERLPAAVASVLDQTLRNLEVIIVDDCSTDDTPAVAASLAAVDHRVRSIRLPRNSGGCSVPRNAGMEVARAPWITFLDSDDVLERHACKNMLLAGERAGAEVVAGLTKRFDVKRKRYHNWYHRLYRAPMVIGSVPDDDPERLFDTLSVAKLYRRTFLDEHGLRFTEGLIYEDQLFTAQVYSVVRSLAVIPEHVYTWNYAERATTKSITNRRHELDNLSGRLRVNRLIDEYFASHGAARLLEVKHRKFLAHDLSLYLADIVELDDQQAEAMRGLILPYLESVPAEAYDDISPIKRAALYLFRVGDFAGTRSAMRLADRGELTTDARRIGERVRWTDRHADDPAAEHWLDVTDAGITPRSPHMLDLVHDIVEVGAQGGTFVLQGTTHNPLGVIDREPVIDIIARRRGSGDSVALRAEILSWSANEPTEWRLEADLTEALPTRPKQGHRWAPLRFDLSIALTVPGRATSRQRLRLRRPLSRPRPRVAITAPLHTGIATLMAYRTSAGELSLVGREPRPGEWSSARRRAAEFVDSPIGRSARHLSDTVVSPLRSRLWAALPRQDLVVFESHMGLQYSDSPKYVYQALRAARTDLEIVWSCARHPDAFPDDAEVVWRGSDRYRSALRSARFWCDNQGFPREYDKPKRTIYLQTWHGVPLKHMGMDEERIRASPQEVERLRTLVGRWDYLCSPNDYFKDTLVRSFEYQGALIGPGTPRNDTLVQNKTVAPDSGTRRVIGFDGQRTVVLYAPTFRQHLRSRSRAAQLPFVLDEMAEQFRDHTELALRSHYLNRFSVAPPHRDWVSDMSDVHDVNDVLLASDVLVTDFSSVMFDFALLGRPIVFFAPDYDEYTRVERGTYFDLAEEAPGPLVRTQDELFDALQTVTAWFPTYQEHYERFVRRYCGAEDGQAARRAVETVFLR